jgi:hypothetical protein
LVKISTSDEDKDGSNGTEDDLEGAFDVVLTSNDESMSKIREIQVTSSPKAKVSRLDDRLTTTETESHKLDESFMEGDRNDQEVKLILY